MNAFSRPQLVNTLGSVPTAKLDLRVTSNQVEGLLLVLVRAAARWEVLLGQLELPQGRVEQIGRDTPQADGHCVKCLREGLHCWARTHRNPTFELLCAALRSEVLEENVLAEEVEGYVAKCKVSNIQVY